MTRKERLDLLNKVDFGDIDGYGDPNLDQYFLDNDYWNRVVDNKTYFVIGRKGTGKSSIYRMIKEQGLKKGIWIENKDFGDFPFEKLLQLDDQNFAKPNQYQSIWENLILNIFSKIIAENPACEDTKNQHYLDIANYSKNCLGDVIEMHKEVVTRTTKTGGSLNFQYMVERTMHRPRDLIQFCKYVQKEASESGDLYFRTIKNAEKSYGYWLINSELANEINPILKDTEPVYELLKLLGSRPFSLSDFNDRYRSVKGLNMPSEALAFYLYDVGILQNIDPSRKPAKFRSSYRNKGGLDRNMKIVVHSGVWVGINA